VGGGGQGCKALLKGQGGGEGGWRLSDEQQPGPSRSLQDLLAQLEVSDRGGCAGGGGGTRREEEEEEKREREVF
jgi:hypothetical protein